MISIQYNDIFQIFGQVQLKDVTMERLIEYGCVQEDEDVYRAESRGITVPTWWQLIIIR